MARQSHVAISGLKLNRQGAEILDIPELHIQPGEAICLQGENGSGKSSLLRVLAGLGQDCSGEISVLSANLAVVKHAELERLRADYIGFVFQHYRLVPYLSALDNILLPCHFSQRRRSEAIERTDDVAEDAFRLIRTLNLTDPSRLSKSASAYSAGQQQRFAIARALIGNPRLVLMDEPASAMDQKGRRAVYDLILNECRETGATLVCATHDHLENLGFDRYLNMDELNLAQEQAIR